MGGKLSWNEDTKSVVLKTSGSDKCYVYFDKTKGLIKNVIYQSSNGYNLQFNVDIEKYTDEDLEMQYQVDGDKFWYHNSKNDVTKNKTYSFDIYTLNAIILKPNKEYKVNIRLVDNKENVVDSTSIQATTSEEKCNFDVCANLNNAQAIINEALNALSGILSEADGALYMNDYKVYDKVEVEGDIYLYPNGYILDGFQVLEANSYEISETILQAVGPMTIYWFDNTTKTRVGDAFDFPMMLETPIHEYDDYPYSTELKKLGQNLELWNEDFSEFTPFWSGKDYSLVLEFTNGTLKLKANAA